jgi:hypothetical protein
LIRDITSIKAGKGNTASYIKLGEAGNIVAIVCNFKCNDTVDIKLIKKYEST